MLSNTFGLSPAFSYSFAYKLSAPSNCAAAADRSFASNFSSRSNAGMSRFSPISSSIYCKFAVASNTENTSFSFAARCILCCQLLTISSSVPLRSSGVGSFFSAFGAYIARASAKQSSAARISFSAAVRKDFTVPARMTSSVTALKSRGTNRICSSSVKRSRTLNLNTCLFSTQIVPNRQFSRPAAYLRLCANVLSRISFANKRSASPNIASARCRSSSVYGAVRMLFAFSRSASNRSLSAFSGQ